MHFILVAGTSKSSCHWFQAISSQIHDSDLHSLVFVTDAVAFSTFNMWIVLMLTNYSMQIWNNTHKQEELVKVLIHYCCTVLTFHSYSYGLQLSLSNVASVSFSSIKVTVCCSVKQLITRFVCLNLHQSNHGSNQWGLYEVRCLGKSNSAQCSRLYSVLTPCHKGKNELTLE